MTLRELYPYWGDVHQELLETVAALTPAQLEDVPHDDALSIRQIVLQFVRDERHWIGELVAGYAEYRPDRDEYPDGRALVEALAATRDVTRRILEPFSPEGLRAVRRVPGDPAANRHETNAPVSWLFWHVLELELMCSGQVAQRLRDSKRGGGRFG